MSSSRVAFAAALALLSARADAQVADWPVTEGSPGGGRFSPLTEITRENVTDLRIEAPILKDGKEPPSK